MELFKSHEPNTVHYVTTVTYGRVQVFRSETACSIFVKTLAEARDKYPFKLIGYVVMPDHIHLLLNPESSDISALMQRLRGNSARRIIDRLRSGGHTTSLDKLRLTSPQRYAHTHSVWQKDFSSVDLWSPKFIQQKLNYIHCNPVRAGLCGHPAEWAWSSYRAYLPREPGSVQVEMDWRGYWDVETAGIARLETGV